MYFFVFIYENKSTSEKEQPLRIKMTKMQEQEPDTLFQNRKRIQLTVIFDTLRYPPKPIIGILRTALKRCPTFLLDEYLKYACSNCTSVSPQI